jgi:uncharacterized protein DUF2865
VVLLPRSERLRWAILGSALAVAVVAAPNFARAEGLFDFLFGRPRQPEPVNSYAEPTPQLALPGHRDNVIGGGAGGRYVAFCVRLCDGQHFPLDHNANATPVETCRVLCPTARTKIFSGTAIDHAVASDGARYADLDTAFVYRDRLVANCTCNGRDAFGLSHIDPKSDPTLRPGDIVSTASGPMAFAGRRAGAAAEFTPVDSVTLESALGGRSSRIRTSQRSAEPLPADAQPASLSGPQAETSGDLRGQLDR